MKSNSTEDGDSYKSEKVNQDKKNKLKRNNSFSRKNQIKPVSSPTATFSLFFSFGGCFTTYEDSRELFN